MTYETDKFVKIHQEGHTAGVGKFCHKCFVKIKENRILVLQEIENKFVELGEEGEIKPVQHNVRFYKWLKNEIKENEKNV